jgi:hypothetical protein
MAGERQAERTSSEARGRPWGSRITLEVEERRSPSLDSPREETAFIISVQGPMSEAISSITTAHELTGATLKQLWDEVREFWRGREMTQPASSFLN